MRDLFVLLPSLTPKYLGFNQSSVKPSFSIITCDIVKFTLLRKLLYDNFSSNSCTCYANLLSLIKARFPFRVGRVEKYHWHVRT